MFVMCCSDGSQWPAKQQNTSSSSPSCHPTNSVRVWRLRRKIIRTDLCYVLYDSWAQ